MSLLPDLLAGASKLVHAVDPWGTAAQLARVAQAWWQAELPKLGTLAFMVLVGIGPYSVGSASGGGGEEPDPEPGDNVSITPLTITNRAGATKTNEIVEFGLPVAEGVFGELENVAVFDEDGSGAKGSAISAYQIDNRRTINGHRRNQTVTMILPSIGSEATRNIFTEATASEEPSGTPITLPDVLAMPAMANGGVVVSFDFQGTTYSVNLATLLDDGSTTFSKTGLWVAPELWREGPICSEWRCRMAPRNGDTPHDSGDGVHVEMHVAAYKADPGAVGESNPITALRVDIIVENGDTERSTAKNYVYGFKVERATDVDDGTLISTDDTDPRTGETIRYEWPSSEPDASISLSSSATGYSRTITISGANWPADILGAYITAGGGVFRVTQRVSDSQVQGRILEAFSSTSFSSGNWRIEGVGQPYNETFTTTVWIGQKPSTVWAYGDLDSALSPSTRGHLDYLAATGAILNLDQTYAETSPLTMTNLNNMRGGGAIRPLTTYYVSGNLVYGDVFADVPNPGGRADIGVHPRWVTDGLTVYTDDGRRKLFENAEYWIRYPFKSPHKLSGSPSEGELALPPRVDSGSTYKWNTAGGFPGTLIARPAVNWSEFNRDSAHHPATLYVPALLTGRLKYLVHHQCITEWCTGHQIANSAHGSGINKTPFGAATLDGSSPWGDSQTRAKAWQMRDLGDCCFITPDDPRDTLFNAADYYETRVAKAQVALKGYGPDDAADIYPGDHPLFIRLYGATGNGHPLGIGGTDPYRNSNESPWQMNFVLHELGHLREQGLLDSNGQAGLLWLSKHITDVFRDPDVVADIMCKAYRVFTYDNDQQTSVVADLAAQYRQACINAPRFTTDFNMYTRTPSGSVTLSDATVGTGRTMTFENDYFSNGGSWYEGGYILGATSSASASAPLFKITGVDPEGKVLTGDVLVAFEGTSLTASNVRIPGPHPDDYTGYAHARGSDNNHQGFVTAARLVADNDALDETAFGHALDAIEFMTGIDSYLENERNWKIKMRRAA